jgi:ABC-type antimicrobial peptide transport system permease subunit
LRDHFGDRLERARLAGVVLSALGALALLLSVLGIYGVVSFAVSRRQREVGIRMALGAGRDSVVRLFIRDVAGVVIGGAVVGLAVSLPAGRFIGQEFTGAAGSLWLLVLLAAGLVGTALLATLAPAMRAANTDPRDTLRQE